MAVANATLNAGPEASTDNTSNNPLDMANEILELEPNNNPFLVLTQRMKKVAATNPKFQWQEDLSMPWLAALSASATSGATSLGVSADIFRVGDVVRITSTGEAVLVTATAAGVLTVTRGLGSGTGSAAGAVAPASAASAAELFIISNANAEGATLREFKYPQLSTVYNYTEIVRTPVEVTGTEKATIHYGGDEHMRLRAKFGIEHARNLERMFWFGARDIKNTNQRTSGGVVEFLSTNKTNQAGTLSLTQWNSFLKGAFRYGSERKVAFVSPSVKAILDGFIATYTRVNDPTANASNSYGIDMTTYGAGAAGVVDIVMCRSWNDSTKWGKAAFIIDPANVEYHYLRTRDTQLRQNVQAPDYDGFKDEYLTECGLKLAQEATHALIYGITGGA
jgi:hypothetical protein